MKFYDLEIELFDDETIMLKQGFDPHMDADQIILSKEQARIVANELLRIVGIDTVEGD